MSKRQQGFTIIELLIATVVFSVLLLVLSGAIIQIGRLYMKGMTSSRTQATSRAIIEDVTQNLQLGAGSLSAVAKDSDGKGSLCVGSRLYQYQLGMQRTGTNWALRAYDVPGGCNAGAIPTSGAQELLGENMRLASFDVSAVGGSESTYEVTVRVVYGDDDLLCVEGDEGGCSDGTTVMAADTFKNAPGLRCKNIRSGSQFCAMSELSTIVERRL